MCVRLLLCWRGGRGGGGGGEVRGMLMVGLVVGWMLLEGCRVCVGRGRGRGLKRGEGG